MTTITSIPASHFLADGPQVFEFCAYPELDVVTICRWFVEPMGNRKHARRITGQFRYDVKGARQLWAQLKKNGSRPFGGFED